MIRTIYRNSKGNITTDLPPTHWHAALNDSGGVFWADFCQEPPERVEPLWRDIFGFHPLAIDDALNETHIPKVDNWGQYIYIVAHSMAFDAATLELTTREVDALLGCNYIVTHHHRPNAAIDRLWTNIQKAPQKLERGADHVLYNLLDLLTADYLPAIDALDEAIDRLEDEIFERPTPEMLNTIFTVKRAVLHLRRILGPQREVLNRLARDEYTVIDAQDRVYFRDVYDHLVRLADLNESLRDLSSGMLDTYLSVTSNRINQVMKILTILTALFMPISFLAGFFGMNFLDLPFDNRWLLAGTMAAMLIVPVAMLLVFRRRYWI